MEKTHLDKLEPELHEQALKAFHKLANDQRGEPEDMGGGGRGNPDIWHAMGLWTYLSEHVGDISNRIANRNHVRMSYGIDMAEPKVRSSLRILQHRYGVAREIDENLAAALKYEQEKTGQIIDPQKWRKDWILAAVRYADAHKKLVVYNEAQFCAREAAIRIGALDYPMAEVYLSRLSQMMNGDDWDQHAGTVYVDSGKIAPYTPRMKEVMSEGQLIKLSTRSKSPDAPAEKFMTQFREETSVHPMLPTGTRIKTFPGGAVVSLDVDRSLNGDDSIHLTDINSMSSRGAGYGSAALKWLCDLADIHRVKLEGWADTYMSATNTLGQRDLKAWYSRYGFKIQRGNRMIRQPQ